jgi:hypothetical protein
VAKQQGVSAVPRGGLIHEMMWWRNKWLPPPLAQVRGDLPRVCGNCGVPKGWEDRTLFCSKDYRLHRKNFLFEKAIGIGN